MTLKEYLDELDAAQRQKFCKDLKRAPLYVVSLRPYSEEEPTERLAGAKLAIRIEELTNGQVPRWEMRGDLWPAPSNNKSNGKKKPQRTARAS